MKNLKEMLLNGEYDEIWTTYLGFLDLNLDEFMEIQERLLLEQLNLLSKSKLGSRLLGPNSIASIDEFRRVVPLTTYDDYADILLNKKLDELPSEPMYWVQTTWKGGKNDIKLAPYSKSMVEEHTKALLSSIMLSTSSKRGKFSLRNNDKFLFGMAPLPYLTGFAPYILKNEVDFQYFPSTEQAEKLDFIERNKVGFNLAIKKGADLFFGLSSVLVKIGEGFSEGLNKSKSFVFPSNPKQAFRLVRAAYKKKILKQKLMPKDLFEFKGIVCAGTDSDTYKEKIEELFGIKPLEIYGGTEVAAVATETWSRNGMTFFPDVNFLEFISEDELSKEKKDANYRPQTILLNEIEAGKFYELVTTKLRGGAFVRYRVGDMIKCVALENKEDKITLPQIKFLDRVQNIIDLSGFTRITPQIIGDSIKLSNLGIKSFTACKELGKNRTFINLYIEDVEGVPKDLVKEKINTQMKSLDNDYNDVHTLLGHEPLKITYLTKGTFDKYKESYGEPISKINPTEREMENLIACT